MHWWVLLQSTLSSTLSTSIYIHIYIVIHSWQYTSFKTRIYFCDLKSVTKLYLSGFRAWLFAKFKNICKLFFKLMKLKVGTDHWHYQHEHHHHKVKLKCFIDFLLYFPLLVSDSVSTFAPTLFTGFSLAKDPKVSFWQSIWRTRRYSLLISDERVLYIMENIAPAVMNGIEIGIAIWKFILT